MVKFLLILVYIVKYLTFHHKDALSLQQLAKCNKLKKKTTLISFCQLPAFKHGDITVNESVAACLYLEVKCENGNKTQPLSF